MKKPFGFGIEILCTMIEHRGLAKIKYTWKPTTATPWKVCGSTINSGRSNSIVEKDRML